MSDTWCIEATQMESARKYLARIEVVIRAARDECEADCHKIMSADFKRKPSAFAYDMRDLRRRIREARFMTETGELQLTRLEIIETLAEYEMYEPAALKAHGGGG